MLYRNTVLVFAALGILAGAAAAVGFTGELNALETLLVDRRGELEPDAGQKAVAKKIKAIDKILGTLRNPRLEASYADELKGFSKAAKLIEKKLGDEDALLAEVERLTDFFQAIFEGAAANLDQAAQEEPDAKVRSRMEKNLRKATKALDKAKLGSTDSKRLKGLSKAAKVLQDWIEGEDEEEEPPGTLLFVVSGFQVAAAGVGYDIDQTGGPDNALANHLTDLQGMGFDLDPKLAEGLQGGPQVAVIGLLGLLDLVDDAIPIGIANAFDTDDDTSDNFSGAETFEAGGEMVDPGVPPTAGPVPLVGGAYSTPIQNAALFVADAPMFGALPGRLEGTLTETTTSGVITVALDMDVFVSYLVGHGLDLGDTSDREDEIRSWADIDTDGMDGPDAISAAFAFSAVRCAVVMPPE